MKKTMSLLLALTLICGVVTASAFALSESKAPLAPAPKKQIEDRSGGITVNEAIASEGSYEPIPDS